MSVSEGSALRLPSGLVAVEVGGKQDAHGMWLFKNGSIKTGSWVHAAWGRLSLLVLRFL